MNSFDKSRRLLKKSDFDYVFSNAKKRNTKEFTVLFRKNSLELSRLGMIISKKIVSKAHDRNRIKRLVRETFRTISLPAVDIVFLSRKGIANLKNEDIISELNIIWKKLELS